LDGMQPTFRQTPPSGPRLSTMTTFLPFAGPTQLRNVRGNVPGIDSGNQRRAVMVMHTRGRLRRQRLRTRRTPCTVTSW
jgi:hypothetical protein